MGAFQVHSFRFQEVRRQAERSLSCCLAMVERLLIQLMQWTLVAATPLGRWLRRERDPMVSLVPRSTTG